LKIHDRKAGNIPRTEKPIRIVRFCRVDMEGIEAELKVIKDYLMELYRL